MLKTFVLSYSLLIIAETLGLLTDLFIYSDYIMYSIANVSNVVNISSYLMLNLPLLRTDQIQLSTLLFMRFTSRFDVTRHVKFRFRSHYLP